MKSSLYEAGEKRPKENKCGCTLCAETECHCDAYARFFSTLGNSNRLHIINALRRGPQNVSQIMALTGFEQTCISHCLSQLERDGFVSAERNGKYRIYTLNKETVEPLMRIIDQHITLYEKKNTVACQECGSTARKTES